MARLLNLFLYKKVVYLPEHFTPHIITFCDYAHTTALYSQYYATESRNRRQ